MCWSIVEGLYLLLFAHNHNIKQYGFVFAYKSYYTLDLFSVLLEIVQHVLYIHYTLYPWFQVSNIGHKIEIGERTPNDQGSNLKGQVVDT